MKRVIKNYSVEILLAIITSTFSFWLMRHTFSYQDGQMLIATKAWSDFASHIPLIRSFSFGDNFPPEYPLFPGEPIRYHFLFYSLVGLLEKTGLRIDFALNIPSALSFTILIFAIYLLAKTVFKSRFVGILSAVFFLFNGSLSFLEFFNTHPISPTVFKEIINNTNFPSFGPYDGKTVAAFWNLNIYTNQRHLALPFALLILMVWWIFKREEGQLKAKKYVLLWGIFLGLLPLSHSSIFVMSFAVLGVLLFLLKHQRMTIVSIFLLGILISLPRVLFLKETATFIPILTPGYLIGSQLNFINFLSYWFQNLGLALFLIPVGFAVASRQQRKLLSAFFPLFLLGNLIQFSPEMASNHKFFNVFLAVSNMFVAYVLIKLWELHNVAKPAVLVLFFGLTFSGIIDLFPIKNDSFMQLDDYHRNPDVKWVMENTPKNAVFLNSSYLYHPASLAGRKIFLGWPYFAWSLGHDTHKRATLLNEIYTAPNKTHVCTPLKHNRIAYVTIEDTSADSNYPSIDTQFFYNNFTVAYKNPDRNFAIFGTSVNCD